MRSSASKKPQTLPVVLSPEEVRQFLGRVDGTKHRAILKIQPDCGGCKSPIAGVSGGGLGVILEGSVGGC